MDFGDTQSQRTVSGRLSAQGDDTERLHDQINRAATGLASSVNRYEYRAAQAFQGRWNDVGSVLRRLASDSQRLAHGLTSLADSLDSARREWESAGATARAAGFVVHEGEHAATVTAPADTADDSADHAQALQNRMRSAARDADRARSTLRRLLTETSTDGLAALEGVHSAGFVSARTGDPGLDSTIDHTVRPMLAVHANLPRTA